MIRMGMNIIIVLFALFTIVVIAQLYWGIATGAFSNGAGMAILFFQLYGFIAAIITLVLGLIAWFTGDKTENPPRRIPKAGVIIGGLGLLALILPMVF